MAPGRWPSTRRRGDRRQVGWGVGQPAVAATFALAGRLRRWHAGDGDGGRSSGTRSQLSTQLLRTRGRGAPHDCRTRCTAHSARRGAAPRARPLDIAPPGAGGYGMIPLWAVAVTALSLAVIAVAAIVVAGSALATPFRRPAFLRPVEQ